jgi:hypothetical protein
VKHAMLNCLWYNMTYFKENCQGFFERSMLLANTSIFEFFCLMHRVWVNRQDILITHYVMLVNQELQVCKYQPKKSTIMEEEALEK